MSPSLQQLQHRLKAFAQARNWGRYHSPKNLASALVVEAGELLEHFQWMTESESRELSAEQHHAVSMEMADVMCYLLHLANELNVDVAQATAEKITLNESRFPIPKA